MTRASHAGDRATEVGVDAIARRPPTRRQTEVLRAYLRVGSVTAAAVDLGIAGTTERQHLSNLYRRSGVANAAQAAYLLGRADRGRGDT